MIHCTRNVRPCSAGRLGTAMSTDALPWESAVFALMAEALGVLVQLLIWQVGVSNRLQVLSGTLLVVALVAGLVTLGLTPLTLKLRQTPPPRAIVVSAIIAGGIPAVTVLLLALR